MSRLSLFVLVVFLCQSSLFGAAARQPKAKRRAAAAVSYDPLMMNDPTLTAPQRMGSKGSLVVRAQVMLDRANFSVGEISGAYDANTRRAVMGFQKARGVEPDGVLGPGTWALLNSEGAPALVAFTPTDQDLKGPFQALPEDMMERSKLPALGYQSPAEMLGERFHASPDLLKKLNPGKTMQAGEELQVPNVEGAAAPTAKAARVEVSKADMTLYALGADGTLLAQYPVSFGRDDKDPLPIGDWKVNGVQKNPVFHYNPALFWDADPSHSKAKIPPGPNNPVGVVWIDLSKEHYGIHGTPEPSSIGKTRSHGCIRLTNWDAAELAGMVQPGMPAVLKER